MKKIRVVLLAMALILGSMGTVQAFPGDSGGHHRGHGPGMGMGMGFPHMLQRLELSEEQEIQVAAILKRHRDEIGNAVKEMVDSRVAFMAAAGAQPRSEEAVKQAATRVGDAHVQMLVLRSTVMGEVREVLTSDQVGKIETFRSNLLARLEKGVDHRLSALDDWIMDHEE